MCMCASVCASVCVSSCSSLWREYTFSMEDTLHCWFWLALALPIGLSIGALRHTTRCHSLVHPSNTLTHSLTHTFWNTRTHFVSYVLLYFGRHKTTLRLKCLLKSQKCLSSTPALHSNALHRTLAGFPKEALFSFRFVSFCFCPLCVMFFSCARNKLTTFDAKPIVGVLSPFVTKSPLRLCISLSPARKSLFSHRRPRVQENFPNPSSVSRSSRSVSLSHPQFHFILNVKHTHCHGPDGRIRYYLGSAFGALFIQILCVCVLPQRILL